MGSHPHTTPCEALMSAVRKLPLQVLVSLCWLPGDSLEIQYSISIYVNVGCGKYVVKSRACCHHGGQSQAISWPDLSCK